MDEREQLQLQGQLDQFGAALRDLAPQIAGYYKALMGHGMPPRHAVMVTMQLHELWLRRVFSLSANV